LHTTISTTSRTEGREGYTALHIDFARSWSYQNLNYLWVVPCGTPCKHQDGGSCDKYVHSVTAYAGNNGSGFFFFQHMNSTKKVQGCQLKDVTKSRVHDFRV
jgi:hypothetical protein